MTEDSDDDRMERADRIRRMREGRRSRGRTDGAGEAETAEELADDDGNEAAVDEETADEQAAEPASDDADAAEPDDTADADVASAETNNGQAVPEEATASSTVDGTTEPESVSGDGQAEEAADTATDTNGAEAATADDAGGFEFEQSNGTGAAEETDADELAVEPTAEAAELAAGEQEAAALAETQRDVAASVTADDAERAVAGLGSSTFAIPDQATTVSEDDDALDVEGTVAAARAAAAAGRRTAAARDRTRVLEFDLGDERFCLDIDYVEEIVELENMTRVPNSPSYVEGVVDLRGQVTAIINPKDALDVGNEGRGDLIIVFDSEQMDEQGHLGWVVDEVRQVTPVSEDEVNESPNEDAEHINGVINREDEDDFVVWTTPELALNSS